MLRRISCVWVVAATLLVLLLPGSWSTTRPQLGAQSPKSPLNKVVLPKSKGEGEGADKESAPKPPVDEKAALAMALAKGADVQQPLAFQAVGAKNALVEVFPATVAVPTTKRAVMVAVKCKAKVGWFITNSGSQPVEYLQLADQPFVLVFPNAVDEVINVYAYTAVDGTPTMARAVITVGAGKVATKEPDSLSKGPLPKVPPKEPSVEVKPLPSGSKIHFTIVHDIGAEKINPRLADLVLSSQIVKGLQDRGHFRWVYDKTRDAAELKLKGFDVFMEKTGAMPMFIVQDSTGLVIDYRGLTGSPAGVLAYVDKLAPRK